MIPTPVSKAFGSFGTLDTSKFPFRNILSCGALVWLTGMGRRPAGMGFCSGPISTFLSLFTAYIEGAWKRAKSKSLKKEMTLMWEEDFGALNYSPVVSLWFRAGLISPVRPL